MGKNRIVVDLSLRKKTRAVVVNQQRMMKKERENVKKEKRRKKGEKRRRTGREFMKNCV